MIAKLIVYGDTRAQAIARMQIALSETVVEGIQTNVPLHRELMRDTNAKEAVRSHLRPERLIAFDEDPEGLICSLLNDEKFARRLKLINPRKK